MYGMQHTEEEVPYQHDSASSMEYEKRENEDMIRTILNEEDEAVVPSKNEPNETEEEEIISYEEALTRIGFGPFQLMMMHICGAGSMFDGIELSLVSFVIPGIRANWELSPAESGALGSIVFFGMMFGAWFGGFISDRFGRKWVFCSSIFIAAVFIFVSSFSVNFWMLLVLRFFGGIGLGAMVPCDFSLMLEYLPKKNRGALLGLLQIYWTVGAALECLIAWLSIEVIAKQFDHDTWASEGWRWCMGASSAMGMIIFVMRLFVPESPRFYLVHERYDRVDEIMNMMARWNRKPPLKAKVRLVEQESKKNTYVFTSRTEDLIRENGVEEKKVEQMEGYKALTAFQQVKMLFSREYLVSTLLLFVIWFMLSFGGWGFNFLIPIVFEQLNHNNVYLDSFYVTGIGFISNIITLFIIDRIPRRIFMGVSFIFTGLFTCFIGISDNPISVLVFSLITNFLSCFPWAVVYTYTPEMYPTSIRTTGMGSCSVFTRLAGSITPVIGTIMLEQGYFIPFLMYGLSLILAGICSFLLKKETYNVGLDDTSHQTNKKMEYEYSPLSEPLNRESNQIPIEIEK